MPTTGRGIPPWHLWGQSQILTASDNLGTNTPGSEGQLVRISYGRPETWHWLFFARLLEAPNAGIGTAHAVSVEFDLTIGVGRTTITLPSFEYFFWNWGNNTDTDEAPIRFPKWSTQSLGRQRVDVSTFPAALEKDPWATVPLPTIPPAANRPQGFETTRSTSNVIDKIVAQDIQLRALMTYSTLGSGAVKAEVGALFAPNGHVRPEWFIEQFPGGEHAS